RVVRDAAERQVDERHVVAGRERPGNAFARGDVLVDQGLGEGALARSAPDQRQLVRRDEAGGGDQVCDELGERVDRRRRPAETRSTGRRRGLRRRAAGGAQLRWTLSVHLSLVRGIGRALAALDAI